MHRFLLVRLGWAVPTVLAIVVANFLIMHLAPGDPLMALVGNYPAPPSYIAAMRQEVGLDQPLWMQLWLYLVNMAHGRLGFSFANHEAQMQRFKSARHARRFLSAHGRIHNHFQLRRHRLTAEQHRAARDHAFRTWRDLAGVAAS